MRARGLAPGNSEALLATGSAELNLGRWEEAIEHLRQAERLDPRSVSVKGRLGTALMDLRRYPEAREVFERGLAYAPANLSLIERRAMTFLGEGDLAAARDALSRPRPKRSSPRRSWPTWRTFNDLVWLLDEHQRALLQRLTPSAFDNDKGDPGRLCLTQAFALEADKANVHSHAEEARKAFEEQLRAAPQNGQRHALLGLVLAYLGRKEEAIPGRKAWRCPRSPVGQHSKWTLQPVPTRTHLPPRRGVRESARCVGTAPEEPRFALAGVVEDRPHLRPASREPAVPEASRRREVNRGIEGLATPASKDRPWD